MKIFKKNITVVFSHVDDKDMTRAKGEYDNSVQNSKYFDIKYHIKTPFVKTKSKFDQLYLVMVFFYNTSVIYQYGKRKRNNFITIENLIIGGEENV